MFKKNDPYTYSTYGQLQTAGSTAIGLFSAEYQVTHDDDVQLGSGTVQSGTENDGVRKYLLECTQRIKIYNSSAIDLRPESDMSSYSDYPALINTLVQISPQAGLSMELVNFAPQTVNTQVQTSGTNGSSTGETNGSSTSSTVGSSTSQTNSFGASVGSFGDLPTSSVSADHSKTTSQDKSFTSGSETSNSNGQDSSGSSSMSMKDWGAYCMVNPSIVSPSWTFGQEYPWDAIVCRKTNNTSNPDNPAQVQLVVPSSMTVRLYDGVSLSPPSHLSMFGVSFVMKAQWRITINNGTSDVVDLQHIINYFTASHSLSSGSNTVAVYLDSSPTLLALASPGSLSNALDLGVLGLAPISMVTGPAIIGFLPAKFSTMPIPAGSMGGPQAFKVFSAANNLRVTDTSSYPAPPPSEAGFSASETSLTATMTGTCTQLKMSLLFKIVDVTSNYTLFIKHWKITSTGAVLNIVINGDTSNTLVKYVDALESEGGENNLLSIALRDLDVTSADFHDYLTLGLNSVDITISPINGSGVCAYQVRAISIEAD